MPFDWMSGNREELIRLGRVLDETAQQGRKGGSLDLTAKLLRVRNRDGAIVPLEANRAQLIYEQRRGRGNIVLKARQLGITTWVAGRFFLKTITHPGTLSMQVAHTQEAAESIFRIVHRFLRLLPPSLRGGALKTSLVNARQIVFPEIDCEYRVESAGSPNAGRGLTITNLHCSEVARWRGDPAEILHGLKAALSPRGEIVLESTPMGAAGCFWKEWQDASTIGLVRHFFPWWVEDSYVAGATPELLLNDEEKELMAAHGLTLQQISFRRHVQRNLRGLAKQEYAEDAISCFLTSGECIFDTASIDLRLRQVSSAAERRGNGSLYVWLRPVCGREYLVAVDPAGGGSEGDFSAVQVIDLVTGLQCAELRERLSTLELAYEAAALAREYNHALLVVERNNHGSGVLAYLQNVCHYERLYQSDGQMGWLTSAVSRPRILAQLGSAMVETPAIFASERLLLECRSFVRHSGGRTEAQAGEHDDCVMAMAIALAVREEQLTSGKIAVA